MALFGECHNTVPLPFDGRAHRPDAVVQAALSNELGHLRQDLAQAGTLRADGNNLKLCEHARDSLLQYYSKHRQEAPLFQKRVRPLLPKGV